MADPRPTRVVAVLGYSGRNASRIDPICAARLAQAHELAADADAVVLSGWARHPAGTSEADLMRAAWPVNGARVVCDTTAASTVENAANVVFAADELEADELVVVTSAWHRRRTQILFRAALRDRPVRLSVEGASGRPSAAILARELVCLAFLPVQLRRLRRAEN
jgi:uncharacterized SAM-binding protein YcdF (DUF218 family)